MATTDQPVFEVADDAAVKAAREALDAHTVEMMAWHFIPPPAAPFGWNTPSRCRLIRSRRCSATTT